MGVVAAVVAVAATVASISAQQDAKEAAGKSAEEQRKARQEQAAEQARQQADEKRKMVREERVRRGRLLQASENTGTTGSSGELGALGSLSTQLSANTGANAGMKRTGEAITGYNQAAADFSFEAQQSMADARMFQDIGSLVNQGASIFSTPSPKKE